MVSFCRNKFVKLLKNLKLLKNSIFCSNQFVYLEKKPICRTSVIEIYERFLGSKNTKLSVRYITAFERVEKLGCKLFQLLFENTSDSVLVSE